MSDNQQAPGLVTGHVKLAGGAVEAALGNLTGNTNLQSQGEQYKQAGIAELKSYQDQNPPTGHAGTTGKIEQTIGSAVGCEGMVNDAQGSTTSSSTATGTAGTTGPSGTINPGDNVAPAHLGGTGQPGFGTGGASADAGSRGGLPESRV